MAILFPNGLSSHADEFRAYELHSESELREVCIIIVHIHVQRIQRRHGDDEPESRLPEQFHPLHGHQLPGQAGSNGSIRNSVFFRPHDQLSTIVLRVLGRHKQHRNRINVFDP